MSEIQLKRIYEPPDAEDGLRVFVDRLWARGMSKANARLDAWMKELGPSDELRGWFGHRAERWNDFQERYRRVTRLKGWLTATRFQRLSHGRVRS